MTSTRELKPVLLWVPAAGQEWDEMKAPALGVTADEDEDEDGDSALESKRASLTTKKR